jgi:hypothetical protein
MDIELKIIYLNNQETIIKFCSESNKRFNQRIKLIKILENNNLKWKEAHKISKIWYNIIYNKCKYLQNIYLYIMKLNKMLK